MLADTSFCRGQMFVCCGGLDRFVALIQMAFVIFGIRAGSV